LDAGSHTFGAGKAIMKLVRIAFILVAALSAGLMGASYDARAEVTRIEIMSRADVLAGRSFGDAGPYEKIVGKVYFALDPSHPRNSAIVDLDKAPRDATGRVLFSADLYVLAPKDAKRGNGVALFAKATRWCGSVGNSTFRAAAACSGLTLRRCSKTASRSADA
jgi:hypothetical protein